MSQTFTSFPDIEKAVRLVLLNLDLDGLAIATMTPPDPTGAYGWLPFLRVTCFAGSDDRFTDTSRVDVDAFAATKADAQQLAESARQVLIAFPHKTAEGVIDMVSTDTKPNQVPYGDEHQVVRYTAAYTVTARRSFGA